MNEIVSSWKVKYWNFHDSVGLFGAGKLTWCFPTFDETPRNLFSLYSSLYVSLCNAKVLSVVYLIDM